MLKNQVVEILERYEETATAEEIENAREYLASRYEMTAHREVPTNKEPIFARLVALHLILDNRSQTLYGQPGVIKNLQVGDTRAEFATAEGLDQNTMLTAEFDNLWRSLIATTRRFLR